MGKELLYFASDYSLTLPQSRCQNL